MSDLIVDKSIASLPAVQIICSALAVEMIIATVGAKLIFTSVAMEMVVVQPPEHQIITALRKIMMVRGQYMDLVGLIRSL